MSVSGGNSPECADGGADGVVNTGKNDSMSDGSSEVLLIPSVHDQQSIKFSDRVSGGVSIEAYSTSISSLDSILSAEDEAEIQQAGAVAKDGEDEIQTSEHFVSWPYGFQLRACHELEKNATNIMGVTYNGRMRQIVYLDATGITTWNKDAVGQTVTRGLRYPKYEYRLLGRIVYARKYNVYFGLGKDFSLKVLNRDFEETCSVNANLRSVLFMIFNPVRDELITGGVEGTKVWMYHQVTDTTWNEIKPMANYKLSLKHELSGVGGSWVKRVDLDLYLQHLYCCSDTDLYAYNMQGQELYHFARAHALSITGCVYSTSAKHLVTASADTEVKVWNIPEGLIHTFRGHSQAVTDIVLHPEIASIVITSSLDGTVRMWSLDTMECIYSITVSSEGVLWMGITDERLLYIATSRSVSMWGLNTIFNFWAVARNRINNLSLVSGEEKSTRLMVLGEDSSVRLFSRRNRHNLSTVLPLPNVSPLQQVRSVVYNRIVNHVYVLVDHKEMWIYTTKTDPACRLDVWNIAEIQQLLIDSLNTKDSSDGRSTPGKSSGMFSGRTASHRSMLTGMGTEQVCECMCLCSLNSPAMVWTSEGYCCPLQRNYLLFGLEDGRILFMDPGEHGLRHLEFRANKYPILNIVHDREHGTLITHCAHTDAAWIQVWALPSLQLLHEVYCPNNITSFARLDDVMLTGHSNGGVLHHQLVPVTDNSTNPQNIAWQDSDFLAPDGDSRIYEHPDRVLTVDACPTLSLFLTASCDGSLKLWDENKVLISEVMLDESLTAACFLNGKGDVAIGFKNHIFTIDHTKLCPNISVPEEDEELFDGESDIYEDPAVRYEGMVANPDPIDMESYLVPFDVEYATQELVDYVPEEAEEKEDTVSESELSAAPTDVYLSPHLTPRRRSLVDLTLQSEATHYDLKDQLEKQLDDLDVDTTMPLYHDIHDDAVELPRFGTSPGPSPESTRPPTPVTPALTESGMSVILEGEEPEEMVETNRKSAPTVQVTATKKSTKSDATTSKPRVPPESRLSKIRIDASSVLKQKTRRAAGGKVGKVTEDDDSSTDSFEPKRSGARPVKKKQFSGNRRMPRRGEKVEEEEEKSPFPVQAAPSGFKGSKFTTKFKKQTPYRVNLGDGGIQEECEEESMFGSSRASSPSTTTTRSSRPSTRPDQQTRTQDAVEGGGARLTGHVLPPGGRGAKPGATVQIVPDRSVPLKPSIRTTRTGVQAAMEFSKGSDAIFVAAKRILIIDRYGSLASDKKRVEIKRKEKRVRLQVPQKGRSGPKAKPGSQQRLGELTARYGRGPTSKPRPDSVISNTDSTRPSTAESASQTEYTGVTRIHINTNGFTQAELNLDGEIPRKLGDGYHQPHPSVSDDDSEPDLTISMPPTLDAMDYSDVLSYAMSPGQYQRSRSAHSRTSNTTKAYDRHSNYEMSGTRRAPSATNSLWDEAEETRLTYLGVMDGHKMRSKSAATDPTKRTPPMEHVPDRPLTAFEPNTKVESIRDIYDSLLKKYQSYVGDVDKLYLNNGNEFDKDYNVRMIERHMLLKMQRSMRAKSANEKRQLLMMRQQEQRKALPGHTDCDTPGGRVSRADTGQHIVNMMRANSAGHMADRRKHTIKTGADIVPDVNTRGFTPGDSRPQTTAGRYLSTPGQLGVSVPSAPAPTPTEKDLSLHHGGHGHQNHNGTADRTELSKEQPFRCRISLPTAATLTLTKEMMTKADDAQPPHTKHSTAWIRPRKPQKSIPNKCSRYVLVTHTNDGEVKRLANPLEAQLIVERFPQWTEEWLGDLPYRRELDPATLVEPPPAPQKPLVIGR